MRISDWSSDVCSSDRDAGRQAAAADVELGALAVLDAMARRGGGAFGRAQTGKHRLQHLGRGDATATNGLEQVFLAGRGEKNGSASCRERLCPSVSISVVAISLTKKNHMTKETQ